MRLYKRNGIYYACTVPPCYLQGGWKTEEQMLLETEDLTAKEMKLLEYELLHNPQYEWLKEKLSMKVSLFSALLYYIEC